MSPENQPQNQPTDQQPPVNPIFQPQPVQPTASPVNPIQPSIPPVPPQPFMQSAAQPQYQQPVAAAQSSSKGLSIVGFVLAFVFFPAGLIISIISLSKSKKAGEKNGLALAGIIISSIGFVVATIMVAVLASTFAKCKELGNGTHLVDGVTYTCSGMSSDEDSSLLNSDNSFTPGTTEDYTALGYMDYVVPESWTYSEEYSASQDYQTYIFFFKDSKSMLSASASGILGDASYEGMINVIVENYGEPVSEEIVDFNGVEWYHVTTESYTSDNLGGDFHNELYFVISDLETNQYLFEFYVSDDLSGSELSYFQDSVDYILDSAVLYKADE